MDPEVCCDEITLHYVLAKIGVGSMFEVVPFRTVEILTKVALEKHLLCVESKAILIDGLQRKGIRFDSQGQQAVENLMLSTKKRDLTYLKSLIESGSSYHNLTKLIYSDMNFGSHREVVISLTHSNPNPNSNPGLNWRPSYLILRNKLPFFGRRTKEGLESRC